MAGAALSDFAGVGAAREVDMVNVVAPIMLLPFAAIAARQLGVAVTVEWDEICAVTNESALSFESAKGAPVPDFLTMIELQAYDGHKTLGLSEIEDIAIAVFDQIGARIQTR